MQDNTRGLIIATIVFNLLIWGLFIWLSNWPAYIPSTTTENITHIQTAFETMGMKLGNSISDMGWFYAACLGLTMFLFGYGLGSGESIREGWHRPNVKKPWPKSYDNWGEPIYDAEKMREYEYSKRPNKWMPFFITIILVIIPLLLGLLVSIFWG